MFADIGHHTKEHAIGKETKVADHSQIIGLNTGINAKLHCADAAHQTTSIIKLTSTRERANQTVQMTVAVDVSKALMPPYHNVMLS